MTATTLSENNGRCFQRNQENIDDSDVFIEFGGGNYEFEFMNVNQQGQQQGQQQKAPPQPQNNNGNNPPMDFDDDIPFSPIGLQYGKSRIYALS